MSWMDSRVRGDAGGRGVGEDCCRWHFRGDVANIGGDGGYSTDFRVGSRAG